MAPRRLGFWQWVAVVLVEAGADRLDATHLAGHGAPAPLRRRHRRADRISHADPLVSAHFIHDAGRWPQFLAKASVFRVPMIGWILHRCKQIPVERGSVEAARSLDKLVAALREGGAVVIYPGGTTTREPDLWPMKGKTGAARLALATGAPVIPVAMWGPEQMFNPRTARLGLRPRTR